MRDRHIFTISSASISNQDSHNLHIPVQPTVELDPQKKYLIALRSASIPYSFFNISSTLANNTLIVNNAISNATITFPDGQYEVSDLQSYIHYNLYSTNDYTENTLTGQPNYPVSLQVNQALMKCVFSLSSNYSVILDSDITKKLGWDTYASNYVLTSNTSTDWLAPNIAQIELTDRVFIHCDLCGSSLNGKVSTCLYSCPLTVGSPGGTLTYPQGDSPIYVPMRNVSQISNINIWLTDGDGKLLNVNDEDTEYVIEIIESD